MVLFKFKIDTSLMQADTAELLFVNKPDDKKFTSIVTGWFQDNTGIKTGTLYQRKKSTSWWTLVLYCTSCNKEYKLKGNIKKLKDGEATEIMIFTKQKGFCGCGYMSTDEREEDQQNEDPKNDEDPTTPPLSSEMESPAFSPITPRYKRLLSCFEYNVIE